MANDRIFLVCRCGELFLLYKYYPSLVGASEKTIDELFKEANNESREIYAKKYIALDEWIDVHIATCHPIGYSGDLGTYTPFQLFTENVMGCCDFDEDDGFRLKKTVHEDG
jgi:hypothetical protein